MLWEGLWPRQPGSHPDFSRASSANQIGSVVSARVRREGETPYPLDAATYWAFPSARPVPAPSVAAQYLNSGIFPKGSSAGLVSRLAAASA